MLSVFFWFPVIVFGFTGAFVAYQGLLEAPSAFFAVMVAAVMAWVGAHERFGWRWYWSLLGFACAGWVFVVVMVGLPGQFWGVSYGVVGVALLRSYWYGSLFAAGTVAFLLLAAFSGLSLLLGWSVWPG